MFYFRFLNIISKIKKSNHKPRNTKKKNTKLCDNSLDMAMRWHFRNYTLLACGSRVP